ncbi:co-chaperone DjlA [Parendozoicomonas haliclonae]|uniref:Co-chaperone protein DjlA n=1 Tax=Parendozoicomonas haliclonae TaxID=1960125 RepID=A0A1X7AEX5_9GAMM|nr:co-chaperone DjlA [Parendozoicomonas haliclonae]SMA35448.1 DnaJ-like protein DjlA [Parendozoicomonas haliclonae]
MWIRTVLFAFLGFLFGGPFGGIMGAVFGAWLDSKNQGPRVVYGRQSASRQRQTQTAFFEATFITLGRLAKADGRVNEEEIQLATALMDQMRLNPEQRQQAIHLFNQGKDGVPIGDVLERFRRAAGGSLIQMFLEIQLQSAWADGQISNAELNVLHEVCSHLGVNRMTFEMLHQRFQAQRAFYSHYAGQGGFGGGSQGGQGGQWQPRSSVNELKEAYATLGVESTASDRDVKRAWRKLMSEHHPDKLISKGLPEEMMEMAKRKTQEIQAAYDLIVKHRKNS